MKDVIYVYHSSIHIPNYELGDCVKLEEMLSVWNAVYFRLDPNGYSYDTDTKTLRVPRGLDVNYLEKLLQRPSQFEYESDPFEKISVKLKIEPRNDIQRKSISFLSGQGKFDYTKRYSQMTLNLDTGDGKTYCAIASMSFLAMKTIIITHNDLIKTQWHDSLISMTNLDTRHICNIDGSATITKLLKIKNPSFKVYQINHRTIQSYAKKHGWYAIHEVFKHLKIGVKIYDEAHLEFTNLIKTDLYTNTKKTIYLTATFNRSQYKENKLFNLCFKNIARYGRETRKEKERHIMYVPVFFNSKPDLTEKGIIKGRHGVDKNKYIDYQLEKEKIFEVIIWLTEKFKSQVGKTLILLSKIDAVDETYEYMKSAFPDKTISKVHSKVDGLDKSKALDSDIIISTPKSLGTGNDIPNLRFVIMTEPYSSVVTAEQTSGRLRKIEGVEYCFYIELIDKGFVDIVKMYKRRLPILKRKCEKILELTF